MANLSAEVTGSLPSNLKAQNDYPVLLQIVIETLAVND